MLAFFVDVKPWVDYQHCFAGHLELFCNLKKKINECTGESSAFMLKM